MNSGQALRMTFLFDMVSLSNHHHHPHPNPLPSREREIEVLFPIGGLGRILVVASNDREKWCPKAEGFAGLRPSGLIYYFTRKSSLLFLDQQSSVFS
jgi:hypothetical protein